MTELLQATEAALTAAGVESARLEAQLLLGLALGVSRTAIVAGLAPEPNVAQERAIAALVAQRAARVPLAYLRKTQEFYGLSFAVSPAVLIPRPETELLVAFALEKRAALESARPAPLRAGTPLRSARERAGFLLADIGTGSGAIAISILANALEAQCVAGDVSPAALAVARENATRHAVEPRLRLVRGSLLTGLTPGHWDVIVANPPYIPSDEVAKLQPEVRDWEPRLALDGGADGLDCVRGLARGAARTLKPGGWLAVEIARGQAGAAAALFESSGLTDIATRCDLAGIERVVCGQRPFPARLS